MNGREALKIALRLPGDTVLDVGCGQGEHVRAFQNVGKEVWGCNLHDRIESVRELLGDKFRSGDFLEIEWPCLFDTIWCCHVLEHVENPHLFLKQIKNNLRQGGYACVTVPPRKDNIVSGHVSLWNAGLLLYHLIMAGFNCRNAKVRTEGYNCSVIVSEKLDKELSFPAGLEDIQPYLPMDFNGKIPPTGFNGVISSINWEL